MGLALGAALVVAASAIVIQTSDVPTLATPGPTRSAAASRSAAATGVAAQISAVDRALAQARQTGKAVPVTLAFSERDLTTSAAAYFPQTLSGVVLSDPEVRLRGAQIVLDTTASAAFLRSTATVVATVSVVNARPATTVVSATIGGAPLPAAVTSDVKAQLDQALAAGLPAKFQVTTITIADAMLTVSGLANP